MEETIALKKRNETNWPIFKKVILLFVNVHLLYFVDRKKYNVIP